MPTIKTFHNSGEWNKPPALLKANVERMRSDGRSLGTRTEVTTRGDHLAVAAHADQHWGVYHPHLDVDGYTGYADCLVEWDQNVWARDSDGYTLTLTDFRPTTERGFKLQPPTGIFQPLRHVETKRNVLLGAGHLSLANTDARVRSWFTETKTLNGHFKKVLAEHPGWEIVWQCDGNRNQRDLMYREMVAEHLLKGVKGLHNCWAGHIPASGGTHGPRSLLDFTASTMHGGSRLLGDDKSSDHRPYETWLTL